MVNFKAIQESLGRIHTIVENAPQFVPLDTLIVVSSLYQDVIHLMIATWRKDLVAAGATDNETEGEARDFDASPAKETVQ